MRIGWHRGGVQVLNPAWPQSLDNRKFQRRRSRGLRGQNRARLHQKAANAFVLVLRLAGRGRDNLAIPVDENHSRAGTDGDLAAILRKRQPARRVKIRMGERACQDIKKENEHAKGYGGFALSRAPTTSPQPISRLCLQCAFRWPEKHPMN